MRPDLVRRLAAFRETGTVLLLLAVVLGAWARQPRFLEPASVNGILLWVPLIAVVGLGQMLVIVTRGIDVSVGSMVGLSAMAVGMLFREAPGTSVPLGALCGVAVGLGLGAVNGLLVSRARIPPIIATLGALSAYRGLVFIVSQGRQVDSNDLPDALTNLSLEGPIHVAGVTIPWTLVGSLAVVAAMGWFVRQTRMGRDVFALGSNPGAARLRGIRVERTLLAVYALTGALCGLAGTLYASRFGFVNPATAGQGLELVVIAAVVIGGTNVVGGSGTVLGVLLGSLLLGAINVALSVMGIAATWQQLVYGTIIVLAVVFDTLVRRALSGDPGGASH